MSTDREVTLPIDAFMGVDRQVSREDITDFHSYATQNLWEKVVGQLETRGHSVSLASGWPSNVVGLDNEFRIFKKNLNHSRFVAVHCNPDATPATLPTITMAFVSDLGGGWMNDVVAGGTTLRTEPKAIWIRYYGYGIDYSVRTLATAITGYAAGPLRLDVTGASVTANPNITGIEIYAEIECGATSVVGATYNASFAWVGHYDFTVDGATTKKFYYAPIARKAASSASGEIGELERTYDLTAAVAVGGSLESGRTYYVAVLAQHFKWNADPALCKVEYRQNDIDYATEIRSITLPEGYNSITIANISPSTVTALIAIGESPQTLIPCAISNPIYTSNSFSISRFPKNTPALVGIQFTSDTNCNLRFVGSDHCVYDMLTRIEDDGTKYPIFMSRGSTFNLSANDYGWVYNNATAVELPSPYRIGQMGRRGRYRYTQHGDLAFFVNGARPSDTDIVTSGGGGLNSQRLHTYSGNYMVCDGFAAGLVCMQMPYPPTAFPFFNEISKYQESIILAGGISESSFLLVNEVPDSSNFMYYSQTSNPYNFTTASDPDVYQYIRVEQGGEPINGIGLFTTTTSDEGPDMRLLISKRNSLWILGNLPQSEDAAGTFLKNLSKKVGAANSLVFSYTPVGTVVAGVDNVYLLRESGEPVPIGDPISPILKRADMTNASACYHDEQYKLAFYHPDYAGTAGYNNVEMWLDIKKMKAMQGKPDWKGPMIGRQVDFSLVEDLSGDGDSYNNARDRLVVDRLNMRIFKADVTPLSTDTQILDFATPVTSILETKDYQIGEQDKNWNKLITRQYWKLQTNKVLASPLTFTETTWVDGAQVESKSVSAYGVAATAFDEQPQKVNPVFPTSRYRGRTVRKRLSTTDRVGIGGFVLHYRVERRRI